ncbi:TPA: hypothetical protein UL761_001437 [Stenotrophomonas maltophilia]|nr:hypothetical protein [Stenotrophomonas maltophilia]
MIDELKAHWPLIQQYPWDFLWVFVLGVSIGLGIPALWRKMFPGTESKTAKPGVVPRIWSRLSRRKFSPSPIQYRCVQVLRYFDHRELTAQQVHQSLKGEIPVSDIDQALDQLTGKGWATWHTNYYGDGFAYKLAGDGLDFARKHKMEVGPQGS